ncbi:MAG: transglutaminase-like domain-containing protein [Caldilineaceae bacterium]
MLDQELLRDGNGRYAAEAEQRHWAMRFLRWLATAFQPALGWGSLFLCGLLLFSFIYTLTQSRWLPTESGQPRLLLLALLALLSSWWLYGWRADRTFSKLRWLRIVLNSVGYLLLGTLLVSQLLAGWLPGASQFFSALRTGDWQNLGAQTVLGIDRLSTRIALWWQTIQADDPVRDDLMLLLISGVLLWLVAGVTVGLLRRYQRGLLAATPIVALAIALLFWGREDRSAILVVLVCALLLHLWLHQKMMQQHWNAAQLDYSPMLLVDRMFSALAAGALVIVVALLLPNLYIRPLALWYWHLMSPANQRINEFREQILPDVIPSTRWREGVGTGGLPNEFLLGAGPEELSNMLIMVVRTNEGVAGYDQQPEGHYMRGLTLAEYDGKGWRNPDADELKKLPAEQRWLEGDLPGRQLLAQSVEVRVDSPMLFAAGEAVESSVDSQLELLPGDNLIGLRSWEQRYTVVSAIPAVGEQRLNEAGEWNAAQPLPAEAQSFLQLPSTVPPRVHELAQQLTITATTLYSKATALESYLRQYPYDLSVPAPPADVVDVADYFLFDLKKGYCDYYATAFVVMARSLGIPARIATGYSVGYWNFNELQWTITEAQAHAWPEVYFPKYGWIPFEPTAARPMLNRIDVTPNLPSAQSGPAGSLPATQETRWHWNWQMLFWLLPVALLLWWGALVLRHYLRERGDPWQSLLRWGARRGRPITSGDTILEYGEVLSTLMIAQSERTANRDGMRGAAREVSGMSEALSALRYADAKERSSALSTIARHWQRIKDYLR